MAEHRTTIVYAYAEHWAICSTCGWVGPIRIGDIDPGLGLRDAVHHTHQETP